MLRHISIISSKCCAIFSNIFTRFATYRIFLAIYSQMSVTVAKPKPTPRMKKALKNSGSLSKMGLLPCPLPLLCFDLIEQGLLVRLELRTTYSRIPA